MGKAIVLRTDHMARKARRLAKRAEHICQAGRLLAITAVLGGRRGQRPLRSRNGPPGAARPGDSIG
jgi:hypothetical protein